jgi:nicotinate phosphoribosyltransferase
MSLDSSPLLTDLYQLTMLQAYFDEGMDDLAVFEFFVRKLPPERNFLLAAGLAQVLEYLENLQFSPAELEWLAGCGRFHERFLESLRTLRFRGEVYAMPEGSVFFADEPILQVVAPLPQAQLVETRIINVLQYQTLIASKASRIKLAASRHHLVDFGLRRAHGFEAGLLSARASYIAGFDGSSNVLAGMQWDIPIFGTMAHSYVQAHDFELAAFEKFAHSHPQAVTLLIDTYDTLAAAHQLVPLAHRLAREGIMVRSVRLDSGDLVQQAFSVRRILDDGKLPYIRIFVSGNLDEYEIAKLLDAKAPIDGFGVGTRMNTCADQPYLDCAYKLQEYAGIARRKRAEGKATWPGRKQVYRTYGADGRIANDVLATANAIVDGQPMLRPVMHQGHRLDSPSKLDALRDFAQAQMDLLPDALRTLTPALVPFTVEIASSLRALTAEVDEYVACRQSR